jgi:hypothetical protein
MNDIHDRGKVEHTVPAKSFGDVLDSVLADWRRFIAFIVLLMSLGVTLFVTVWGILWVLGGVRNVREIQLSSAGAHILVEKQENDRSEYLVVVHPQGWQPSSIQVRRGESVSFYAGGRVNVDVGSIVQVTSARKAIEDRITAKRRIDRQAVKRDDVPERYFGSDLTAAERQSVILPRPWTDPNGFDELMVPPGAFAGRKLKRVVLNSPLGALIGAITSSGKNPSSSDAFVIGTDMSGRALPVTTDGELWFSVNDVWDDDNPTYPQKFYDDNVGFYWVKVTKTAG